MIYLDGLPDPPARDGWWDPARLAEYISTRLNNLRHQALSMRDTGGTREDWQYFADLQRALALRAWDEISKGGG